MGSTNGRIWAPSAAAPRLGDLAPLREIGEKISLDCVIDHRIDNLYYMKKVLWLIVAGKFA